MSEISIELLRKNYESLKKQNKSRAVFSKINLDQPLSTLFQKLTLDVSSTLDVERVSIWRYDQNKSKLICLDLYQHSSAQHSSNIELAVEDFPSYFDALEKDRILAIDNARTDDRTKEFVDVYLEPNDIFSMLDLPIMLDGSVYGVLCLEQVGKFRKWGEDEIGYGVSMSDFAALMLESANRRSSMDALISQSRHVVMGEMIAMLSHQWKQPLTSHMLEIGTLKEKIQSLDLTNKEQENLLENISIIESTLNDQNSMIKEFRDFFHPGKEGSNFSIYTAVKSATDALKGLFKKYSISVNVDIDKDLSIYGYERDIRHVVLNILNNAIDQIIDKKVKNPLIAVQAKNQDDYIEISIEDNALGVDKTIIKTIFEPYVSTKKMNGTGLGLYIGKRIMKESFDGDIKVTNTSQGAKFSIFLSLKNRGVDPKKIGNFRN